MKLSETSIERVDNTNKSGAGNEVNKKPFFRPAEDDTKPQLRDPILRSDPIETEEAVLRLPPLPDCIVKSK